MKGNNAGNKDYVFLYISSPDLTLTIDKGSYSWGPWGMSKNGGAPTGTVISTGVLSDDKGNCKLHSDDLTLNKGTRGSFKDKWSGTVKDSGSTSVSLSFHGLSIGDSFIMRFCKSQSEFFQVNVYFTPTSDGLKIVFPESLRTIGENAFTGAAYIELNEGLESIGTGAFASERITEVTIPASVKELGAAFSSTTTITFAEGSTLRYNQENQTLFSDDGRTLDWSNTSSDTYTIPSDVIRVESGAFSQSSVKSINIPSGINWGTAPFLGTELSKVTFASDLVEIPDFIFAGTKLVDVTIPSQIETIGERAFFNIPTLKSVTVSSGSHLSGIGSYAFLDDSALAKVMFESSAEGFSLDIGVAAFYKCDALESIVVGDGFCINQIGDAAFAKSKPADGGSRTCPTFGPENTTGIVIPKEVTYIGEHVFRWIANATGSAEDNLTSKDSIRTVVRTGTLTSNTESFTIVFEQGSQIATIGAGAFGVSVASIDLSGCSQLTDIYEDAFAAYGSLKLPENSKLKTMLGLSSHSTLSDISAKSNEIIIPATVESFRIIENTSKISFEEGTQLKTLTGSGYDSLALDLSNCSQLESTVVPKGKVTLPEGVYSMVPEDGYVITNAEDVIIDSTTPTVTSSTRAINRNIIGKVTLVFDGTGGVFGYEAGMLTYNNGDNVLLEGVADAELKTATIGSGSRITELPSEPFKDSAVETIRIEKDGLTIGSNILGGCNTIRSVYLLADPATLTIAGDAFSVTDDTLISNLEIVSTDGNVSASKMSYDELLTILASTNRNVNLLVSTTSHSGSMEVTGLHVGGYSYLFSTRSATVMKSDLLSDLSLRIEDNADGTGVVLTVDIPEVLRTETSNDKQGDDTFKEITRNVFDFIPQITVKTKKTVDFYALPGYSGLLSAIGDSTVYLAYGQAGGRVFVPTSVDGTPVFVGDVSDVSGATRLSLSFEGGYAVADMELSVDSGSITIGQSYADVVSSSDTVLSISKKDRSGGDMVSVTFYGNGGTVSGAESYTVSIPRGCTLIDSDIPTAVYSKHDFDSWNVLGTNTVYDFDTVVTSYTELIAVWESERNAVITISTDAADILYNGNSVESIKISDGITEIDLSFEAYDGYEILAWLVDGSKMQDVTSSADSRTLRLTDLSDDVTVSLQYRYHSSSAGLIPVVNRDLPDISEILSVVRVFEFGGSVNTSGPQWTGHDSVPLIVDNYVYVRAGDYLYKIESDTGYVTAFAKSISTKAFYHMVPYGNGVIFDYLTDTAYDLDLNVLFKLDRSVGIVEYHDGYFYSSGSSLYRFAADTNATGTVTPQLVGTFEKTVYGSYGFTGSVFIGDCIYRTYADGAERGITALDIRNGKTESVVLPGLKSMMLDDGWISENNGTIYLTGYAQGLFGVTSTTADDAVAFVKADGLTFGTPGSYTFEGQKSFASQFIVANGYGYVKAGALYVFDLRSTDVPSADNLVGVQSYFPGGHGSIVLDVTDATEENGWMTYVYSIPYDTNNSAATMAIVEVHIGSDGKAVFNELDAPNFIKQYNSQAVRADLDGRMVWYNDSGHVFSYTTAAKNLYYFFISDGTSGQWYEASGATAADALRSLGGGVATLSSINALKTVWGEDADGWTLRVLHTDTIVPPEDTEEVPYSWTVLANLYDADYNTDHYYAITKGEVPAVGSVFSYLLDGKVTMYTFADNIGDRSVIGKQLVPGTDTVTIRFYEDGTELTSYGIIGAKGANFRGSFPSISKVGYSAQWVVKGADTPASLPDEFESDLEFEVKWVDISYAITGTGSRDGAMTFIDLTVTRSAGDRDVSAPHVLLIGEYSSGLYLNVYSNTISTDGGATFTERFGLSSAGLVRVYAFVVSGMPSEGAYTNYGTYTYAASRGVPE